MARHDESNEPLGERGLLVALAVCCVVPVAAIVVATSVLGIAFGPAVAIAVGLTAAGVGVAVMIQHRRSGHHQLASGASHEH